MLGVDAIFQQSRVIPVISIERAADAVPLCQSLLNGGLCVLEITLRTKHALAAIAELRARFPQAVIGAGTVLNKQQLQAARTAGAQFLVSPGTTPALLAAHSETDLPLLPGAATPSEMLLLAEQGFLVQKFFPAEAAGGLVMLKSLVAPLAHIRFCPTGGIQADNAAEYLALPNVIGIGGSWMVSKSLIENQRWSEIEQLALKASAL